MTLKSYLFPHGAVHVGYNGYQWQPSFMVRKSIKMPRNFSTYSISLMLIMSQTHIAYVLMKSVCFYDYQREPMRFKFFFQPTGSAWYSKQNREYRVIAQLIVGVHHDEPVSRRTPGLWWRTWPLQPLWGRTGGSARRCVRCWLLHPPSCEPQLFLIPDKTHRERSVMLHYWWNMYINSYSEHPDLHEYDSVGRSEVHQAQVKIRALLWL